jgi:formate dehydrogenase maturation protein FdhE
MEDKTKGYSSGDKCPQPKCGGLIQSRTGTTVQGGKEVPGFRYAQCSKCSWNSLRG